MNEIVKDKDVCRTAPCPEAEKVKTCWVAGFGGQKLSEQKFRK